ncbi:MAG TPA: CAP domain-containing protein [Polyangia bacterium]|jgi:uncharacterized protein YkwD|nr:CAP domain-containing protein [Polyangia bacterium]
MTAASGRLGRVGVAAIATLAGGFAGCIGAPATQSVESRLGQPMGDFPGYDERVTLYATNRARADPAAEGWPAYPAQPPLLWNYELNQSARAHSIDMRDTPCFQHNSCDGSDAFKRVDAFFTGAWTTMGENISAGRNVSDGFIAVHNWIYEIGAAPGEIGHRENIFSAKFTLLGAGFAPGGSVLQNYWTQDFVGASVTRPRLADGIHFPRTVAPGASVTFATTYFDASSAAPVGLAVVVDGVCNPLALARGLAGKGAYEVKLPLADGCHPYFFVTNANANLGAAVVSYPDSGALAVGVGASAASCAPFASTRSDVRCDGAPDAGAAGGTSGVDGAMASETTAGAGGAGGQAPADAPAGIEPDGGGGPGTGGAVGQAGPDGSPDLSSPAVGGCTAQPGGSSGCRVVPGTSAASDLAVLALLYLMGIVTLSSRRRRQLPPAGRGRRDDV